ncbi:sigma-70 family RNA polymerase sigma factor [Dendrosporobacter sp. 1207_IL3150]|uniref:sigma-70 family RNA polymerase sigma factor n=1 Tax=Dendrosporobacter sp. 1207_IL3150 TaxID=3084054 RepID=UPI002FDADE1E
MQLKQYLSELNKVRLLEASEEQYLWREYKENDNIDCRRKLIESYQPLVFKSAVNWKADESTLMDIVQEGTVGLIEAVENYDHTRGVAFSLFASHRIRGRMLNFMEREGKRNFAYIDSPLNGEETATLGDTLIDTAPAVAHQAERNFLAEQVKNALNRLPNKEQLVLSGVYLQDQEPKQLAESMDLSVSHIYRLQKQGIRRIRGMLSKFMHNW